MILDPLRKSLVTTPDVFFLVLVGDVVFPRRDEPVQQRPFRNRGPVNTGARCYGNRGISQDRIMDDAVEASREEVYEADTADTVSGHPFQSLQPRFVS